MSEYSLTLYIPLFNEEDGIKYLYDEINKYKTDIKKINNFSIVLIDDGSTDKTKELLELYFTEPEFRIITHKVNKNLGGFLRTAMKDCQTEYIGFIDSDCSYSIPTFLSIVELSKNGFEIVNASPYHPDGNVENISNFRLIPSLVVNKIYRFLTKKQIFTSSSICKIYKTSIVKKIILENDGFVAVVELLTKASLLTNSYFEYPCTLKGRLFGKSKIKFFKVVFGHLKYILYFNNYVKKINK